MRYGPVLEGRKERRDKGEEKEMEKMEAFKKSTKVGRSLDGLERGEG